MAIEVNPSHKVNGFNLNFSDRIWDLNRPPTCDNLKKNTSLPIVAVELGTAIEVKYSQFSNALLPILVTELGSTTACMRKKHIYRLRTRHVKQQLT